MKKLEDKEIQGKIIRNFEDKIQNKYEQIDKKQKIIIN